MFWRIGHDDLRGELRLRQLRVRTDWRGRDQDPTNKVSGILTYGDPGADVVLLDFNAQSKTWYTTFQPKGWYSMMCHHPGGHEVDPMIAPLSLRFFKDHPFKVSPEPYATMIPTGYPSYCTNTYH